MRMQAIESECVMDQSNNGRPSLVALAGLTGLMADSAEMDMWMALNTSIELPVCGFHTSRYQSSRREGQRGMRHARLV